MNAVSSKRMLDSYSDNPKWLGCAIVLTFIFGGVAAQAQQPAKIPRIGFVTATGNSKSPGPRVDAFRSGLRDLGYTESL